MLRLYHRHMMRRILPIVLACLIALPASAASTAFDLDVGAERITNGSVPRGALRVPFLQLTLTATCENDVPVRSVEIRHTGNGDTADIRSVYAMIDGVRVSDVRTPSSTKEGRVTLRLRGVTVPACGVKQLMIVADMEADAAVGGEHFFILETADGLDVDGMSVRYTDVKPTTMPSVRTTPATSGTVNVAFLELRKPVRYGANRTVSRFTLKAQDKDLQALSMTLTNDGSASDADLRNLSLVTSSGERVTKIESKMDGDVVTLTFDPPFKLEKNASKLLELRADIRSSRKRTIRFTLDELSDLLVMPAARTR